MKKIKRPKIGEYVLVTRWNDKDPYDPWCIGFIKSIIETKTEVTYQVEGSNRYWKNVFRITREDGEKWLRLYGNGIT